MIFHFRKRREKPQAIPEWVRCTQCDLEIPSDDAFRWEERNKGDVFWTHPVVDGNYTCQQPYFREREVGRLKKPPRLLARLPIWN